MDNPYARRPTGDPRPDDERQDAGKDRAPSRDDVPRAPTQDDVPRPPGPNDAPRPPGPNDVPRPPGRWPQRLRPTPQPLAADPETVRKASRFTSRFTLLVLAGLLTMNLPVPWLVGSLAFTLCALVVGYGALRFAWRSGLREQVAPLLMFGLTFAVLIGMSSGGRLAMWPVEVEHQECLGRAVTIAAGEQCEVAYQDALKERLADLTRLP